MSYSIGTLPSKTYQTTARGIETLSASVSVSLVDGDNIIDVNQTDIIITGVGFLAYQETGKVEICNASDYSLATKTIEQTNIDSWNSTSIQFDADLESLYPTP